MDSLLFVAGLFFLKYPVLLRDLFPVKRQFLPGDICKFCVDDIFFLFS